MLLGLMITGTVLFALGLLASAAAPRVRWNDDPDDDSDSVQPWTAWLMGIGFGVFAVAGISTGAVQRGLSEPAALLAVCAGLALLAGWTLGVYRLTHRRWRSGSRSRS